MSAADSSETVVPAIQEVTQTNTLDIIRSVKALLDVREGRLGNPVDANVTFRDLINAGIAKDNLAFNGFARGSYNPVFPVWAEDDGYDGSTDLTQPPIPTNFALATGLATIQLAWDEPKYRNHSYTEVWRGETSTFNSATLLGTTNSFLYSDAVGKTSKTYYYWIRFISIANVPGPYNATAGTSGTTSLVGTTNIENAAITNAKIGDLAVDSAKIADAAIVTAKIADGNITNAKIANATITTAKIGDAQITTALIKDAAISTAKIGDAQITNAKIADTIQSDDFVDGSAGWRIQKSGNAQLNNAVFRGTIDVSGGTGQASLQIKNNVIKVRDSSGTLRVQLGDLSA
jgi:hypothetical protein